MLHIKFAILFFVIRFFELAVLYTAIFCNILPNLIKSYINYFKEINFVPIYYNISRIYIS